MDDWRFEAVNSTDSIAIQLIETLILESVTDNQLVSHSGFEFIRQAGTKGSIIIGKNTAFPDKFEMFLDYLRRREGLRS